MGGIELEFLRSDALIGRRRENYMRKIYLYTSQQIANYSVKNFWGANDRGSFPSSGEKENYTE
jgi:hypothetical protein